MTFFEEQIRRQGALTKLFMYFDRDLFLEFVTDVYGRSAGAFELGTAKSHDLCQKIIDAMADNQAWLKWAMAPSEETK